MLDRSTITCGGRPSLGFVRLSLGGAEVRGTTPSSTRGVYAGTRVSMAETLHSLLMIGELE